MKCNIYSIKDTITRRMISSYLSENDEQAKRTFRIQVKEDKDLNLIKEDLQLYKLGELDEETGEIKNKIEIIKTTISIEEYRKIYQKQKKGD